MSKKTMQDKIKILEEENGELERANIMHRNLNRGVAVALGLKFGDSWHDLPEKVNALKLHNTKLEKEVSGYNDVYDIVNGRAEEWEQIAEKRTEELIRANARITELEKFIKQIIKAGDDVCNAYPACIKPISDWDELTKDQKR